MSLYMRHKPRADIVKKKHLLGIRNIFDTSKKGTLPYTFLPLRNIKYIIIR